MQKCLARCGVMCVWAAVMWGGLVCGRVVWLTLRQARKDLGVRFWTAGGQEGANECRGGVRCRGQPAGMAIVNVSTRLPSSQPLTPILLPTPPASSTRLTLLSATVWELPPLACGSNDEYHCCSTCLFQPECLFRAHSSP